MTKPIVFISYSHDSDEHKEKVLALSERLRADGLDTRLDQHLNGASPETWPRWMLNQLDEASFVLVVCTETYYRRFRGKELPGKGKGVDWEGSLITQELYDARRATLKFVPILFDANHEPHVPQPLRGLTHYHAMTKNGYDALYDFLLDQAGVEPGEVGELKRKPRAKGQPLSFDGDGSDQQSAIHNPQPAIKISLPPPLTPHLFGRDDELQLLDEAWANPATKIVVFHALGGAGKSALVSKWLAQMAKRNYDATRRVFGWSFSVRVPAKIAATLRKRLLTVHSRFSALRWRAITFARPTGWPKRCVPNARCWCWTVWNRCNIRRIRLACRKVA